MTAAAWIRKPVKPRMSRRRAHLVAGVLGVITLTMGAGSAAAWIRTTPPVPPPERTVLGPVSIHLPDDVGPWSAAPDERLDRLRASSALVVVEVDGAWGVVAPGAVVVTVMTAGLPVTGGGEELLPELPNDGWASWTSGRGRHVVGSGVTNGTRSLTLALVGDEMVILDVSGPVAAFDSGSLRAAFEGAVVESVAADTA